MARHELGDGRARVVVALESAEAVSVVVACSAPVREVSVAVPEDSTAVADVLSRVVSGEDSFVVDDGPWTDVVCCSGTKVVELSMIVSRAVVDVACVEDAPDDPDVDAPADELWLACSVAEISVADIDDSVPVADELCSLAPAVELVSTGTITLVLSITVTVVSGEISLLDSVVSVDEEVSADSRAVVDVPALWVVVVSSTGKRTVELPITVVIRLTVVLSITVCVAGWSLMPKEVSEAEFEAEAPDDVADSSLVAVEVAADDAEV
jgi:hypothetical protein